MLPGEGAFRIIVMSIATRSEKIKDSGVRN